VGWAEALLSRCFAERCGRRNTPVNLRWTWWRRRNVEQIDSEMEAQYRLVHRQHRAHTAALAHPPSGCVSSVLNLADFHGDPSGTGESNVKLFQAKQTQGVDCDEDLPM
jgi:hypothetical protein